MRLLISLKGMIINGLLFRKWAFAAIQTGVSVIPLAILESVFPVQGAIIIDGKNNKIAQEDIDFFMQLSIQTATTLDKAGVYAEIEKYATQDEYYHFL